MAKATGLVGNLRGKVGNVVFSSRRGSQIARVYQPVVHNPKSKRQQVSRLKMRTAVEVLKPFAPRFLRAGWQKSHPTYEFQRAIGLAIPVDNDVISVVNMEASVDYGPLASVMSAKDLPLPSVKGLSFVTEGQVDFNVTTSPVHFIEGAAGSCGCGAVVAVYSPDLRTCVVESVPLENVGTAQPVSVKVPASMAGVTAHVYCFLKQIPDALNGIPSEEYPWMYPAATSECVYVGTGVIA